MIRRPPRSTLSSSSAASDVYKRQEQDARGDAFVLGHEAKKDVLGADVVVAQRERLAQRQLEHLLGARRERDLALRRLFSGADDAHHGGAHFLHRDFQAVEDAGSHAFFLAQQAQQEVFGPDVVVLERPGFFLGEDHDLPGAFGESFEHPATPSGNGAASSCRGTVAAAGACSQPPAYPPEAYRSLMVPDSRRDATRGPGCPSAAARI